MKKRLRKKKHLGEFREYGFTVRFSHPGLTVEARDQLLDRYIDLIESLQLWSGGGGGRERVSFYVTAGHRKSANDEHRMTVERWLAEQPEIAEFKVFPLTDAWHGPFD